MIIVEYASVVIGTGTVDEVLELRSGGAEEPVATVGVQVEGLTAAAVFPNGRVELHETYAKDDHERRVPSRYLTITVPLVRDEDLAAAYALRDEARKLRKVEPT